VVVEDMADAVPDSMKGICVLAMMMGGIAPPSGVGSRWDLWREFVDDPAGVGLPGEGGRMDAQIRIAGGSSEELADLGEWLGGEDELRGRVRAIQSPIGETELGPVTELLTIALGAGGAGTVLASSVKTWLVTRRTTAKITVESAGRSVTLDIQTVGNVAPLLEQILTAGHDD
jgi:hypothetical protein